METNKYYTPNLEEFCIGFEFEDSYGDGEYAKNSIDQLNVKDVISSFLEKEVCIRVKYLDSEDIENLGFSQMQLPCDYVKNNYILYYNVNKNRVRILDLDIVNEGNAVFNGIIRNKSELKRILKMIGAIE